jgi:hypothetical protein
MRGIRFVLSRMTGVARRLLIINSLYAMMARTGSPAHVGAINRLPNLRVISV